jgi:hypothetical protein
MDLWLQKMHTDYTETEKTLKVAIITMINLYNTCRYFRNLLDHPLYFQQFQVRIGYKLFDRFADINSLNELLNCLPTTTIKGHTKLTKLAAGNVVSCPFSKKNYRVIDASDIRGRIIEIDAKGVMIDINIIEICSKMVARRYFDGNDVCTVQSWVASSGRLMDITTDYLCVKTKDGRWSTIGAINDSFIRTVVPC